MWLKFISGPGEIKHQVIIEMMEVIKKEKRWEELGESLNCLPLNKNVYLKVDRIFLATDAFPRLQYSMKNIFLNTHNILDTLDEVDITGRNANLYIGVPCKLEHVALLFQLINEHLWRRREEHKKTPEDWWKYHLYLFGRPCRSLQLRVTQVQHLRQLHSGIDIYSSIANYSRLHMKKWCKNYVKTTSGGNWRNSERLGKSDPKKNINNEECWRKTLYINCITSQSRCNHNQLSISSFLNHRTTTCVKYLMGEKKNHTYFWNQNVYSQEEKTYPHRCTSNTTTSSWDSKYFPQW